MQLACCLARAEYRRKITSLDVQATVLLMQSNVMLVFPKRSTADFCSNHCPLRCPQLPPDTRNGFLKERKTYHLGCPFLLNKQWKMKEVINTSFKYAVQIWTQTPKEKNSYWALLHAILKSFENVCLLYFSYRSPGLIVLNAWMQG